MNFERYHEEERKETLERRNWKGKNWESMRNWDAPVVYLVFASMIFELLTDSKCIIYFFDCITTAIMSVFNKWKIKFIRLKHQFCLNSSDLKDITLKFLIKNN